MLCSFTASISRNDCFRVDNSVLLVSRKLRYISSCKIKTKVSIPGTKNFLLIKSYVYCIYRYVSSITTIFFNSKTLDMERKAIVFWNNLNNSAKDLGKVADTWKPGKLRRVRALNDLSTSREEIFDDEFATCEFPGDLSDDDALTEILRNEKFEGSLSIMEPFF